MICSKCGKTVLDSAKVCPFCNENLENNESQNIVNMQNLSTTPQQDSNQNSKLLKSKRNIIIIFVVLAIIIAVGIIIFMKSRGSKSNKYSSFGDTNSSEVISIVRNENGTAKFIDGTFTDIKVKNDDNAYQALETLKEELKFTNAKEEFTIENKETSEEITYYKFQQKYKDINVYGMNLILSVDKDGKVLSMSGYYIPNIKIDINSGKTKEEIEDIIKNELGENSKISSSEKMIYADEENQTLAFSVLGYSDTKSGEYIVDANSGEIIVSNDIVDYAKAYEFSGNGLNGQEKVTIEEFYDIGVLKTRYRLVDPNRNIEIVDGSSFGADLGGLVLSGVFSSWTPMVGDLDGSNFSYVNSMPKYVALSKTGITTMKQFEDIYDYYDKVLGRKSYDNKGSKIIVNIGIREKTFGLKKLENAAWIGIINQMFIGYWNEQSFSLSKDVLAHEFTHGVVSCITKFARTPKKKDINKAFETGALNEAYADILGSLVEGKDWTINETISTLRDLENPISFKNPSVKGGQYYYPEGYISDGRTLEEFLEHNGFKNVNDYDNGGVHDNSTVPGHAAYLMYKNGAFSSREEMAKVWYNSLFLLSSYANFEDCALAVIKTAKNQGLSPESIRIIEDAFMETKMLEDTRIEIKGTVSSGEEKLKDVKLTLKAKNTDYTVITDSEGKFSEKIQAGTYELTFTKDDFEEYKVILTVRGDTTIDVELASIKKKEENKKDNKNGLSCNSGNCLTFTVYFLDNLNNTGLKENYETYSVDYGTVMGTDVLIKTVNSSLGGNLIQTDGTTFTITMNGFSVDFAWYYKGTNTKFDFNKPIVEDTEIEMKMFNGMIDNDTLQGIYDNFHP